MKLEDAIAFWVTENGYRLIQTLFSKRAHGNTKYAQSNLLEAGHDLSEAEDVIETLKEAMEPGTKEEVYYRGSPSKITKTHRREGFFAVTKDPAKAATYGDLYTVRVHKDVPRLSFAAEGGETLLSDGMVYTYEGKTIRIRPPAAGNNAVPYLGNLYVTQRNAAALEKRAKYENLLNYVYCYSLETPDADVGFIGDCDMDILEDFKKKPLEERLALLKAQLAAISASGYKDQFINEIGAVLKYEGRISEIPELGKFVEEVSGVTGGRRKRRVTRKRSRRALQNRR
jgi:hypothetical protein